MCVHMFGWRSQNTDAGTKTRITNDQPKVLVEVMLQLLLMTPDTCVHVTRAS